MIKVLIFVTALIAVTSGGKKKTIEPSNKPIRQYAVIPIYTYVS